MIAIMLLVAAGCQTVKVHSSDGRPMPPKPQRVPDVPAGVTANRVAMMIGAKPEDSDGNGYPDLIVTETYLFAEPHPKPLHEEGTFVFELFPTGRPVTESDLIARWTIGPEDSKRARAAAPFGPCYVFNLNIGDVRSDVLPLMMANLMCRFEPADGRESIRSRGLHAIQIGRRTSAASVRSTGASFSGNPPRR